jgi:type VI secretion system protein ImpB
MLVMKDASIAPKERINIRFVPASGDNQNEIELPQKTVILGNFTGRSDDRPLSEREAVGIDRNNFTDVLREMKLETAIEVKDTLREDEPDATLRVNLKFSSIEDFSPDTIISQVPELKRLVELREALTALKGPLGNMPAFRKALGELVADPGSRAALLSEIEGNKRP